MPWCVCGGQRATSGSQFFPFILLQDSFGRFYHVTMYPESAGSLSPPPILPWERARDMDACHHILLPMWVPGPELRWPGSQGKCFYC